jgi:hypothetical protein
LLTGVAKISRNEIVVNEMHNCMLAYQFALLTPLVNQRYQKSFRNRKSFVNKIFSKCVLEFATDSLFCNLDDPHAYRFKQYAEKLRDEMSRRCLTTPGNDLTMLTIYFNRHYHNQ